MRSRRSLALVPLAVALTVGLTLRACGPGTSTAGVGPSVVPSGAPSGASSAPSAASVTGGTQTDTSWGRIWDALPPGFPTFPGATPADPVSAEPVSATFAVEGGDPAEIAAWMQAALEAATFGTESLSGPLESGAFVLESLGEGDCHVESTVAPMGGLTIITVRYGAGCPPA